MAQPQAQRTTPGARGRSDLAKAEERTALWLLAPTFIVLLVLAIYPLGQVFVQSFTNARFASDTPVSYVGFQNYRQLLSMTVRELPAQRDAEGNVVVEDGRVQYESWVRVLPREPLRYRQVAEFSFAGNRYVFGATSADFIRAVGDTLVFTFFCVVLETLFGMIIALTLFTKFIGRGVMRAAMLVPWAIVTVVSARIWEWMLQSTRLGFFNSFLLDLGIINRPLVFLANSSANISLQLPSAIAIDVWKTTPFMALLLLAGLATIPGELYEAAEIDGANKIRQFFSITLPLLTPTLAVALIFRTLDTLRVFDLFQVVFGEERMSMASYAYFELISARDVGMSSAASVVIFILLFGFAFMYIRVLGVETE